MKVNFYNNTEYSINQYITVIRNIFKTINLKKYFDIIFVDEAEIQDINKNFRKIDKVTDVISFAYCDDPDQVDTKSLGEVYICVEKAFAQAKEYNHSSAREFAFLAVHGYLHLCGFDHMTKEDEEVMFGIQEDILTKAGVTR